MRDRSVLVVGRHQHVLFLDVRKRELRLEQLRTFFFLVDDAATVEVYDLDSESVVRFWLVQADKLGGGVRLRLGIHIRDLLDRNLYSLVDEALNWNLDDLADNLWFGLLFDGLMLFCLA